MQHAREAIFNTPALGKLDKTGVFLNIITSLFSCDFEEDIYLCTLGVAGAYMSNKADIITQKKSH